jgi:RNA polymerase sigma-70 factor (ECF subfamily)
MSATNVGASNARVRDGLEPPWLGETARKPSRFDVSVFRTALQHDRGYAQATQMPDRECAGEQFDWDDTFSDVVGPLLARLRRLARRILHSDDLAEDAVQEAVLCLWKEGRLPPNPSAWLSRAVVHRSLHLNRSRHRRRRHELLACLHRPESDSGGDAARALEVEEISARIDKALWMLSDRLRMVFVLREIEQMDYESIADRLRIPLGTVRSRLARSREALHHALARNDHVLS